MVRHFSRRSLSRLAAASSADKRHARLATLPVRVCAGSAPVESGNSVEMAVQDPDSVYVRIEADNSSQPRPHPLERRSSVLLPLAAMPRTRLVEVAASGASPPAVSLQPAIVQPTNATPSHPDNLRHHDLVSAAFPSGLTRQFAALYVHVDLTTVERLRWLAFFTILLYLTTCWFGRFFALAGLGIFMGLLGLAACWRPHHRASLPWIKAFVVLNYIVLAALALVLIKTIAIDLPHSARRIDSTSGNDQAMQILVVLVVPIAWLLHWRTQRVARLYAREFRMIEQLSLRSPSGRHRGLASPLSSTSSLSSSLSSSSSSTDR